MTILQTLHSLLVPKKAWTVERVERACRAAFMEQAKLKLGKLPHRLAADLHWKNDKIQLRVDGHKNGLITGTVHELLHYVLAESVRDFDEELEEVIVLALENFMHERIMRSPRRTEWWRKAIKTVAR